MSRNVSTIIFDFDGLILDTESAEFHSWNRVYEDHDQTLPFETWTGAIASDAFEPYGYLESLTGRPVDREEIRATRHVIFEDLMANEAILPGVDEYISTAKSLNLNLAIASNSTRAWLDNFFDRYGIASHFDVVSSRDDVSRGKPAPDIYNMALSRLGVEAHEAIALEDSPNGVLAAKRAGSFCVAVPGPMTKTLSFENADFRMSSLLDRSLVQLLEELSSES